MFTKLIAIVMLVSLVSGCAGLNVSWSAVATYNTPHATPGAPVAKDVPAVINTVDTVIKPLEAVVK